MWPYLNRMLWPETIPEQEWHALSQSVALLQGYGPQDLHRLKRLTERFLASKAIEGALGFEVSPVVARTIAAQACVPILQLGLDSYAGWYSVIVYPSAFRAWHEFVDEAGVLHRQSRDLEGEAWRRGPVILAWEEVQADTRGERGGNVVIHELAHKLDLSWGGVANGMPPLPSGMPLADWTRAFTAAFQDFQTRVETGDQLPFDSYAATSPGEFFAVVSETFFVRPQTLRAAYRQVYGLLARYYRQDGPKMGKLPESAS